MTPIQRYDTGAMKRGTIELSSGPTVATTFKPQRNRKAGKAAKVGENTQAKLKTVYPVYEPSGTGLLSKISLRGAYVSPPITQQHMYRGLGGTKWSVELWWKSAVT